MRKSAYYIFAAMMVLLIVSCSPATKKGAVDVIPAVPAEPVPLPDLEQGVQPVAIEGNTQSSFLGEIMNQMIARLKGDAEN